MIHVVWAPMPDESSGRCCWDQGTVGDLLEGRLWPTTPLLAHHLSFDDLPSGAGAVVVVAAHYWAEEIDRLNHDLARLPWALVILTSDEEALFDVEGLDHPNAVVWQQTPRRASPRVARYLHQYLPQTTSFILASAEHEARPLPWAFAGQVTHERREQMARALNQRSDGRLIETRSFAAGIEREDYLRLLASAKVAPAPPGPTTPSSFRLFEALEAGCVPITEDGCPAFDGGYWGLTGDVPFPLLSDWRRVGEVIDGVLEDWPAAANVCSAWWIAHKRELATDLVDALEQLTPGEVVEDPITVVIPTSPIPSHPSTQILEETVASVRERLPNAEIVLAFDGVRAEQLPRRAGYEEYQRRALWLANHRWGGVLAVRSERHLHQANLIRLALRRVRTPLILFVEHDTPLVGDIEWDALATGILEGRAHSVRFLHESRVLEDHRALTLDESPPVPGFPAIRTAQWSQRPHLASTAWYRDVMATYFGRHSRTMIEDVMHGVVDQAWREHGEEGWGRFRLWLYAPEGDSVQRSAHLDGRADDPKFRMVYEYDGEVPEGAPAPTSSRPPWER